MHSCVNFFKISQKSLPNLISKGKSGGFTDRVLTPCYSQSPKDFSLNLLDLVAAKRFTL